SPDTYPVDGIIDALIQQLPRSTRRFGFDTAGTPFAALPGTSSVYSQGYEHFTLSTFCDGYVIQGSLSAYAGVTPIPNFVNATNLDRARIGGPNINDRTYTVHDFARS